MRYERRAVDARRAQLTSTACDTHGSRGIESRSHCSDAGASFLGPLMRPDGAVAKGRRLHLRHVRRALCTTLPRVAGSPGPLRPEESKLEVTE